MRDLRKGKKLGRVRKQRRALFKALASSLILKQKIKTTEVKAKELRRYIEPLITKAKSGTVSSRRAVGQKLAKAAASKLFNDASRFKNRSGGYTRIIKIGKRKGDTAKAVYMEIVE